MLHLWKSRQGRRAATTLIDRFLQKSRRKLGSISEAAWHDAYIVGFMAMLASLVAREAAGTLNSDALGLVQAETIAELSGRSSDVLGEEILGLSMQEDPDFVSGCRDACLFHAALQSEEAISPPTEAGESTSWLEEPTGPNRNADELWAQIIEERLALIKQA